MDRAGGFDARAIGFSRGCFRRSHEHLADVVTTVRLVDNEGCDPTPRAIVVRHWHEVVGCSPDERPAAVVGDEHIGPRIGEHAFEPTAELVSSLRMAELVEQASELIGILLSSRANRHSSHLGRIMNAR
jgi:hypothetical protein